MGIRIHPCENKRLRRSHGAKLVSLQGRKVEASIETKASLLGRVMSNESNCVVNLIDLRLLFYVQTELSNLQIHSHMLVIPRHSANLSLNMRNLCGIVLPMFFVHIPFAGSAFSRETRTETQHNHLLLSPSRQRQISKELPVLGLEQDEAREQEPRRLCIKTTLCVAVLFHEFPQTRVHGGQCQSLG